MGTNHTFPGPFPKTAGWCHCEKIDCNLSITASKHSLQNGSNECSLIEVTSNGCKSKIFFRCPGHLNSTFIFTNLVSYMYSLEGVGQRSSTGLSKQCWFTPNKHLTWKSKEQMYNQAILFPGRWFLLPLNKSAKKALGKLICFIFQWLFCLVIANILC